MLKPLFKYADFNGRANRAEYWLFVLFQVLLYIGILAFSVALAGSGSFGAAVGTGLLLFVVVALGCFIPNLAVTVRRLHDSNRSAWWLLLYAPGFLASFMAIGEVASLARGATSPDALASLGAPHLTAMSIIGNLCQLVFFVFLVWPGTRGPNRFGDDWRGGIDLTVFDAPEDMSADPFKPAHTPIFDFTSPEPAIATPAAASPPPVYTPPPQPMAASVRQAPVFGKRR